MTESGMEKIDSAGLERLARDGHRLIREGKPAEAQELFERLLKHLPGGRARARIHYRRGESQIVVSRLREHLEPLSDSENLGLEARLALADCCLRRGRVEEGIEHLEQAVKMCPDRAEAYCELGEAFRKIGREELAASAMRKALRLDPEQDKAYHGLAQHFADNERLGEAEKALRRALSLNGGDLSYHLALVSCLMQQGRLHAAWKQLKTAIDKFPEAVTPREMLAEVLQSMGDFDGVLREASVLLKLDPRNPQAYQFLAVAHFHMGRLEEARAGIDALIRLDPMDGLSRLKRALLLQQSGNLQAAMDEYQRVVTMVPEGVYARTAWEAVEALDNFQIQQIILRLSEDDRFRSSLLSDMEATLHACGYRLSEEGLESLRDINLEEIERENGAEPPRITYH